MTTREREVPDAYRTEIEHIASELETGVRSFSETFHALHVATMMHGQRVGHRRAAYEEAHALAEVEVDIGACRVSLRSVLGLSDERPESIERERMGEGWRHLRTEVRELEGAEWDVHVLCRPRSDLAEERLAKVEILVPHHG